MNGSGGPQCSYLNSNNSAPSPGYASFAMPGDVAMLINLSPGPKFWVGVDWYLDFAPKLVVQADARVPSQYTTNGDATILHGPQFFIGTVLGVGFGH